jgi:hypothetical protein
MRVVGVFVVVLAAVSLLSHQYWLLPAGLVIAALGMLLTTR